MNLRITKDGRCKVQQSLPKGGACGVIVDVNDATPGLLERFVTRIDLEVTPDLIQPAVADFEHNQVVIATRINPKMSDQQLHRIISDLMDCIVAAIEWVLTHYKTVTTEPPPSEVRHGHRPGRRSYTRFITAT